MRRKLEIFLPRTSFLKIKTGNNIKCYVLYIILVFYKLVSLSRTLAYFRFFNLFLHKGPLFTRNIFLKRKKLFPFTQTFDSLKSGKVEIKRSASDVNPEAETFLDEGRTSQSGRTTQGAQEFLGSTL